MKERALDLVAVLFVVVLVVVAVRHVAAPAQPADMDEAVVDYVIDGDTVDVLVDDREIRVRLIGIDAPESASHNAAENTEEGAWATEFARQLLPVGRVVYLQKDETDKDKYGRSLRYVWLDTPADARDPAEVAAKMANCLMVEAGYADTLSYWPNITYEDEFEAAKQRALSAHAGVSYLWAD